MFNILVLEHICFEQTDKAQIRLKEQSCQGLHCLLFHPSLFTLCTVNFLDNL